MTVDVMSFDISCSVGPAAHEGECTFACAHRLLAGLHIAVGDGSDALGFDSELISHLERSTTGVLMRVELLLNASDWNRVPAPGYTARLSSRDHAYRFHRHLHAVRHRLASANDNSVLTLSTLLGLISNISCQHHVLSWQCQELRAKYPGS
uniref:Uncharacterized protein n=1 Tax=Hepeviridae sp. TaxID=2715178 RepID=A0A6M3YUP2_9VIRU|nr:MAG: hypothetical protein [Hepeviridae sp.]